MVIVKPVVTDMQAISSILNYEEPLYRPPSEGGNLIIQATIGCSFNRCTFCSMYRSKQFSIRPLEDVCTDIDRAASLWPDAHRVFLADGDALVLPMDYLLRILDHLAMRLPRLARVSCYALPANLLKKTIGELDKLRSRKLSLLYYGIETGNAPLLKRIIKGATVDGMVEGLIKADEVGMKISATVVLGLGGQKHWQEHIDDTIDLLHRAPVNYLSTLQLYLDDSVKVVFLDGFDSPFRDQNDMAILKEQHRLISGLTDPPKRILFRSNHASNALALAGTLPKDRLRLLAEIESAQTGGKTLRPEWLRAL
ncbi:radical SAM protein [Magnetococcales bacterium HHB-1]